MQFRQPPQPGNVVHMGVGGGGASGFLFCNKLLAINIYFTLLRNAWFTA